MSKYMVDGTELTGIANAIRAKTGETGGLSFPTEFVSEIGTLTDTSDANATMQDILNSKTAYVNGIKVTGTFIPLDTSDATATASDIKYGKTAYVSGSKVTGSYRFNMTTDTVRTKTLTTKIPGSGLYVETSGVTLLIGEIECSYDIAAVPELTSLVVGGVDKTANYEVKNLIYLGSSSKVTLCKKEGSERLNGSASLQMTFKYHDLNLLYSL